ncbi:NADP-dependent oxidoreductase [Rhodanobacter sp. Si-c]|uniref:NADP-dependent oxidoreductase n=1 Tax=Rhodanobacter lycopersici TaxID=3162487 RepID=A0ABV3QCZ7_9GAMM
MPQTPHVNRRVLLAARPHGKPAPQDFRLDEAPVPEPQDGQVLLRTLYLSLDPYMRNLMNAAGTSYAPAVAVGAPMVGGTVNRVVTSRHPDFCAGDLVLGNAGWQDYALSDGSGLTPLGDMPQSSLALGALGMTAFTAYVGLLDIGQPKPGETVVVGAATGAVGAVVGQLARLRGARVIGIAGGADKCRLAVEALGYDACLDRHAPQLAARLAEACPDGIDVYFESVGGEVLDAVLPLLNNHARVPVCGIIAHYNDDTAPVGPDHRPALLSTVLQKRIRMQGFVILDHYATRFADFRREMGEWIAAGQVKAHEDVVDGLEQAPDAFIGLLEGRNAGKLVVRVAGD